MFLASIRANNGLFIRPSGTDLVADSEFPGSATEFLITNWTHPGAHRIFDGDTITIRSCATNKLWAVTQERVLQGPGISNDDSLYDLLRREPLRLSAKFPVQTAVGTVKQSLGVIMGHGTPPRPADIYAPIAANLSLWAPMLWSAPLSQQTATPGIGLAPTPRSPGISVGGPSPSAPPDLTLPNQAEIPEPNLLTFGSNPNRRFVAMTMLRLPLLTDPAGRIHATGHGRGPTGPAQNWFYFAPHLIRVRLRAADGRCLALPGVGGAPIASQPGYELSQELTLMRVAHPPLEDEFSARLFHGDSVFLRGSSGRLLRKDQPNPTRLFSSHFVSDIPVALAVERPDGNGEIKDGDWVTLAVSGKRIKINPDGTVSLTAGTDATRFEFLMTKELSLFHNSASNDFASVAEPASSMSAGYARRSAVGQVYIGCRPETVPVRSFNGSAGQIFTTALEEGNERASNAGMTFRGVEGYAFASAHLGTTLMKSYWHANRTSGFVAVNADDEVAALDAGYTFQSLAGHVYPSSQLLLVRPSVQAMPLAPSPSAAKVDPKVFTPSVGFTIPGGVTPPPISLRPIRALVLSGGGAKGAFEAGAAKHLWDQGWIPDIICGVSVGAVNAMKLAEGPGAADRLISLWRNFSSAPDRIFFREFYMNFFMKLVQQTVDAVKDTGIATGIGVGLGSIFLPFGGVAGVIGQATGGAPGFFLGKELSQLDRKIVRLLNVGLNLFQGIHCMQPLRNVLEADLQVNARLLASSGIRLRVGITDIQSGQFFTVSGPDSSLGEEFLRHGRVEVEPDHCLGESWLSRPILGVQEYLMRLDHAVYASSTLPVFMDPLTIKLQNTQRRTIGGRTVGVLQTELVARLQKLISVIQKHEKDFEPHLDAILADFPEMNSAYINRRDRNGADQDCGAGGNTRLLFDGGLRDTMPIRTAIRMGAQDIVVITGDRVQQATFAPTGTRTASLDSSYATGLFSLFNGRMFSGIGMQSVAAMNNLFSLLNVWLNEASRSDMLLAVAQNEFAGWLQRESQNLTSEQKARVQEEFRRYSATHGRNTFAALGASTWLGGKPETTPYGAPWDFKGRKITYISPDREYIDPLNFDDTAGVEDGIHLGFEAARNAVTLSDPIPR